MAASLLFIVVIVSSDCLLLFLIWFQLNILHIVVIICEISKERIIETIWPRDQSKFILPRPSYSIANVIISLQSLSQPW